MHASQRQLASESISRKLPYEEEQELEGGGGVIGVGSGSAQGRFLMVRVFRQPR